CLGEALKNIIYFLSGYANSGIFYNSLYNRISGIFFNKPKRDSNGTIFSKFNRVAQQVCDDLRNAYGVTNHMTRYCFINVMQQSKAFLFCQKLITINVRDHYFIEVEANVFQR